MIEDIIFGDLSEKDVSAARMIEKQSGVRHANRTAPLIPLPGQPFELTLTTSGPLPFDAARCWYSVDTGVTPAARPDIGKMEAVINLRQARVEWDELTWGYVKTWVGKLPPQPAGSMIRYRLGARLSGSNRWIFADRQADHFAAATEFSIWMDANGAPDWARQALVYHIFLDRFYPGDGKEWQHPQDLSGFFGGTLRGVIQKLDYIASLGFNTLWLSPLFASPSHHGYDATDYYQVEPRLGTNEDLKELIDSAHGRGMRVLLDFVANHWSSRHPTFQAALEDEGSPYHDWYTWNHWPDDYVCYFGVRNLPQLNLERGPARNYLLDCASYWLNEGVDGFRLDYAYGPPHDFWTDFRRACRITRPACWLFGEIVHTSEVQASYAGRFDGTLDFLLAQALRETFAQRKWNLAKFESFLSQHETYFPPDFSRPSFLDNHDMNRFLLLADGEQARLKLGALALYTLSGPPIVYYGTEAGVSQERPIHDGHVGRFEEARLPMKWGKDQAPELLETFRRLAQLRHSHPVLSGGARRVLHLDPENETYAYLRAADPAQPGPGDVGVVFNLSRERRLVSFPFAGLSNPRDMLNQQAVVVLDGELQIELAPQSGAFIA